MSINEVAKLAGVSNSTVSRVINHHPRVAVQTVQSVRKAMQELGYVPSDSRPGPKPAARSREATENIAFFVVGGAANRGSTLEELLRGVSAGASAGSMNVLFIHVPDAQRVPERILEQRIDGVLLFGGVPDPQLTRRLNRLPTVWLMGQPRRPDWGDQVMPDITGIGELAAKYLIERGHRRLAFIDHDPVRWPMHACQQGFSAFAEAAAAKVTIASSPDGTAKTAAIEAIVAQLLNQEPEPDGLFIGDPTLVAMLQPALQRRGVQFGPGATELICCNSDPCSLAGLTPAPALIDTRVQSIGRRGVEQLLWRLHHPDVPERVISTIEPLVLT